MYTPQAGTPANGAAVGETQRVWAVAVATKDVGWYKFAPYEKLNGKKIIPIGNDGDRDGMHAPIPVHRGDPKCALRRLLLKLAGLAIC